MILKSQLLQYSRSFTSSENFIMNDAYITMDANKVIEVSQNIVPVFGYPETFYNILRIKN